MVIKMTGNYIQIAAAWYPVTVFGAGKKLGVWFQGCSKNCKDCISPEYQEYGAGTKATVEQLLSFGKETCPDGLVISGGEPFEQPEELNRLVTTFVEKYNDNILVYTGFTLEELIRKKDPVITDTLRKIAVLIDGTYIPELNKGQGLAGSENQIIHVMKHQELYQDAEKWDRQLMCILKEDNTVWMIGVPPLEA